VSGRSGHPSTLHAWLELVRLPNLLTVPGDPMAGFLLAAAGGVIAWNKMVFCAGASLLLYVFGMITNDYFDLEEDRRERPGRPLPSGRIDPRAALLSAFTCCALGLVLAHLASLPSLVVAALLACMILGYNAFAKLDALFGPFAMGVCRGLSLLLGAAAAGGPSEGIVHGYAPAAGLALYVASVTAIARRETHATSFGAVRWLPLASLLLCFAVVGGMRSAVLADSPATLPLLAVAFAAFAATQATRAARALRAGEPRKVQATIGLLLRNLLLMQGFLLVLGGRPGTALACGAVVLWMIASRLSRRFAMS